MNSEYLEAAYADLDERITNVSTLGDINEELVKIAINNLKSLKTDVIATGRNQGVLTKIDTQLLMYEQVARIPELATKFPIIREQSVVLIIGTLEVFAGDVFRGAGNYTPKLYKWGEKEKILVEPSLISDEFTLGDAIMGHLKQKGASFQDLQSLLGTIETYFGVKVELAKIEQDTLILAAAYRNVIVHNRSVIDRGFLKQVRNTKYFKDFSEKKDEKILIDDSFIKELSAAVRSLSEKIVASILSEIETS
jgi:hypothetical protein